MAAPPDFRPIRLTCADERAGRKEMRDMLGASWWRERGRASWAGFAAEKAIIRAVNAGPSRTGAVPSQQLAWDLELWQDGQRVCCEVKTRAAISGWVHPAKFDYITVPMHADEHGVREPIKDAADLVLFNWYSMSDPRCLWVLGMVRGVDEFRRRATWYAEGDPLPRGGWAGAGGAYVIEVKQLRPIPDGLLKELDK